jgi:biotin operon repressor
MEQSQMSKFCIDLDGVMLPDAIAAVVEAWYDAQNADNMDEQQHSPFKPGESIEIRDSAAPGSAWKRGWVFYKYCNAKVGICLSHKWSDKFNEPYAISSGDCDTGNVFSNPTVSGCRLRQPHNIRKMVIQPWEKHQTPEYLDLDIEFKILNDKCKQQILDHLYKLIKSRFLDVGEKMPSIRDLAEKIGFHRNSVLKAYKELEEEGAILAAPGRGFYIKDISKLTPANVF